MSEVIVVATISPKPGEEDKVRAAILAAIPKVHDDAGRNWISV